MKANDLRRITEEASMTNTLTLLKQEILNNAVLEAEKGKDHYIHTNLSDLEMNVMRLLELDGFKVVERMRKSSYIDYPYFDLLISW